MAAPNTLTCAIALALVAVSGTAAAAQLDYSWYAGIEHSDNINLSTTQPASGNILIPGFNFLYSQQGSTLQANVAGALEYRDYLGHSAFDNQTFVQLAGQANWTVLPQRLDFTVQDFAGVQPLSTLSRNTPDNQQQTNVLVLGPTLHFRLGGTLRGQAELRYINTDASKIKDFNSSRGAAALRAFKDLSPADRLSFNIESQHADFPNAPRISGNPNYTRNELFAGYDRTLAHFNLGIALGWSQIDFQSSPTVSSPLARVTLGWTPTSRDSFAVSAARQYSDAAEEIMGQAGQIGASTQEGGGPISPVGRPSQAGAPEGINTGGVVIDPAVYLDRRLEATYIHTTSRLTLSVSPLYNLRTYLNDPTFNQTAHGGSAGLDYRLRERLTLSAFANEETISYRSLDRRDETIRYGVQLSEARTPHWTWRLSITHSQRNSTAPGAAYHENEIYFGVVFKR